LLENDCFIYGRLKPEDLVDFRFFFILEWLIFVEIGFFGAF